MVDVADILRFVDGVAGRFRPARVVLFGSYAYGTPTADSDVDVLVVMNHRGPAVDKAAEIRREVPRAFPMDLLVRSEAVIRRRIGWNDFFLREITEKGLVLYDAHDRRMGAEGRRRLRRRFAAAAVAQA
jgi:predicted nucleotidyltransferase